MALRERDIPMEKAVRYWWTKLWLWQMAPRPPLPIGFLWQQRDIGGVSARTIAFDAKRIFLGVVDDATSGRVVALNKETGSVLWQFPSGSPVADSAIISGDVLLVGSEGGFLYGLDISSGEKVWELNVGRPLGTAPAISKTHLLVPSLEGVLVAYE